MTVEQQAKYWKHKSRKHEDAAKVYKDGLTAEQAKALQDKIAELENAQLTAEQRDFNQQLEDAKNAARQEARNELLPVIQESQIRGYAGTVVTGPRLDAWVQAVNSSIFIGEDGQVDGNLVVQHVTALFGEQTPAPTTPPVVQTHPNFGQGAPAGGSARPSHRDAGLAEVNKRFNKAA
ncbi:hypothetical protein CJ179_38385 [Rhodococcus sp. ACS1]|nr:hypothetical protein CJ179_38385 [Rhodococcus sp. ACS1]